MRNMVARLLRNEIAKVSRTKLPYFGIFAACLVCILAFVVTGAAVGGEPLNGWGYVGLSMQSVFIDIGLIFVSIFSAMLIAEETGSGTVRMVLSSPLLRWQFYTAKALMGLLYMIVMSITALALSILLGSLKYQFGNVTDLMGVVYGRKEVLLNFLAAFFLSWLPLASTVFFGIFISTIAKKSGQAIGVAVGIIILLATVKHFIGIGPYVFTTYVGSSWGIFHQVAQGVDYQWSPEVWRIVTVSLIYCFVTFTAGLAIFAKRDFNG
jgi:ABC-2 type transport system permease protein